MLVLELLVQDKRLLLSKHSKCCCCQKDVMGSSIDTPLFVPCTVPPYRMTATKVLGGSPKQRA